MKFRTLISRVHSPGVNALRSTLASLCSGSRIRVGIKSSSSISFGRKLRAARPRFHGPALSGAGLAKQECQDDRENHAIEERLERLLVVSELPLAAPARCH